MHIYFWYNPAVKRDSAAFFENRAEWRRWLNKYHDKEAGTWLIHYRKDSRKPGLRYEEAVEEAICFGWIDGQLKKIDNEKFKLRYTPRRPKSLWSRINREKAERMIRTGRMTAAGLAKIEEAKKAGFWQRAYTNKTRERMPSDLNSGSPERQSGLGQFPDVRQHLQEHVYRLGRQRKDGGNPEQANRKSRRTGFPE